MVGTRASTLKNESNHPGLTSPGSAFRFRTLISDLETGRNLPVGTRLPAFSGKCLNLNLQRSPTIVSLRSFFKFIAMAGT
jgi:hypothetical protein